MSEKSQDFLQLGQLGPYGFPYNENAGVSHLLWVDGVENSPNKFDPVTLTYDHDLCDCCKILGPQVQRFSLQSAKRHTHTQTDATENITSSANVRGKK